MLIIGITGTLGAGKGTMAEYLVKAKGFRSFSARAFIMEEITRRGRASDRDALVAVGNDLRREYGPDYIIAALAARAKAAGGWAVIESVRALGEVPIIKEGGGRLWAVDADPRRRYERIAERRSATDKISFLKFLSDEAREMRNPDLWAQNIAGVMALADRRFRNDGALEDLYSQIDAALEDIDIEL